MNLVYMPELKHNIHTPPSCHETDQHHMLSNILCLHRALPSVPWETEPRTPPGSPTQPPLAADYTSDEWGCDGWQQADPTGEAHRNAFQPAAIAPPPPRASSGHAQGNKGSASMLNSICLLQYEGP